MLQGGLMPGIILSLEEMEHLEHQPLSGRAGGSSARAGHSPAVLIADDDEAAVKRLHRALWPLSLHLVAARNGFLALVAARRVRFDLLVLELELADLPGLDIVRTLRAEHRDSPFLVVSRHLTVPLVLQATSLGAVSVLDKPVSATALRAAVQDVIGLARAREASPQPRGPPPPGLAPVPMLARVPPTVSPAAWSSSQEPLSTAARWAAFVMSGIGSEHDPRTIESWAKCVGVSRSVLCEACRLIRVAPH